MPNLANFEKNVFVNCPFDDNYKQLLIAIIFTVKYLGYIPRLSLERSDSGESRIQKILGLIEESKFGIHDLSRMVAAKKNEHYRMNMPFELGIDYGCQKLKGGLWDKKKILILDSERYRFQKALSDLSGSDIKNHNDEVIKVINVVRDWFVTEELQRGHSGNKIWGAFNEFQAYLYDEMVGNDGHDSTDDVPIPEVIHHMSTWLSHN